MPVAMWTPTLARRVPIRVGAIGIIAIAVIGTIIAGVAIALIGTIIAGVAAIAFIGTIIAVVANINITNGRRNAATARVTEKDNMRSNKATPTWLRLRMGTFTRTLNTSTSNRSANETEGTIIRRHETEGTIIRRRPVLLQRQDLASKCDASALHLLESDR